MQTRLILAIAISILILLAFQGTQEPPPPVSEPPPALVEEEPAVPEEPDTPAPRDKDTFPAEEEYGEAILTDGITEVTVSGADAGFSSLVILDKDGSRLDLIQGKAPPYPAGLKGFHGWAVRSPDGGETVEAFYEENGVEISRRYTLTPEGMIEVKTAFRGEPGADIETGWYGGLGTTEDLRDDNVKDNTPFMKLDGRVKRDPGEGGFSGILNWAGIHNRYFASILIDMDGFFDRVRVEEGRTSGFFNRGGEEYYPEISISGSAGVSGEDPATFTKLIYAGLKEYNTLTGIDPDMAEVFSFGVFGFLSRLFLNFLIRLNAVLGNYGVAIIILTLILQVFMFPLNKKSFKSMKAMKEIQPKMTKLRKKYKDNPQRMNQEIMALYKKHGVNPLGGCLPMLLQLPIFISLFTMLRSSAELRYSAFLWIRDLASADSLFSQVPGLSSVPVIGGGGPLPLLMGGAMFIQQKMMGSSEGPQKSMMYMMPILFTIMFMNFPAGLVLYWFSNSVFTIISQYSISRKMG